VLHSLLPIYGGFKHAQQQSLLHPKGGF